MKANTINIHAELIERCRKNDASAQYEIYKLYNKAMFNTALRITGANSDAEDVLQEAFVSAFQNLKSYRAEASFGAWLKRIVINKALSHVQRNRNDLMFTDEYPEDLPVEESKTAEEPPLSVEAIKQAMQDLPSGFRSVLTLYLFEGYDHKEISEILNITESTSKTQYKRAKDRLKILLKKEVNYG